MGSMFGLYIILSILTMWKMHPIIIISMIIILIILNILVQIFHVFIAIFTIMYLPLLLDLKLTNNKKLIYWIVKCIMCGVFCLMWFLMCIGKFTFRRWYAYYSQTISFFLIGYLFVDSLCSAIHLMIAIKNCWNKDESK